jgi:hypothetical protein
VDIAGLAAGLECEGWMAIAVNMQSWALAHFSEIRYPLTTQFFPLDR